MKIYASTASHLPVLDRIMQTTDGPILELGIGMFSTPYLHWMCQDRGLEMESFEGDEKYYNYFRTFRSDTHKMTLVEDWDKIDIDKHWGLVLIDHEQKRRALDAIRVAKWADYVVIHDTDWKREKYYGLRKQGVFDHYKYRKDFNQFEPHTTVLSNIKNLNKL